MNMKKKHQALSFINYARDGLGCKTFKSIEEFEKFGNRKLTDQDIEDLSNAYERAEQKIKNASKSGELPEEMQQAGASN